MPALWGTAIQALQQGLCRAPQLLDELASIRFDRIHCFPVKIERSLLGQAKCRSEHQKYQCREKKVTPLLAPLAKTVSFGANAGKPWEPRPCCTPIVR